MTYLLGKLRNHACRIKAECGHMATPPEICVDLVQAALTIETLETRLGETLRRLQEIKAG